MAGPNGLIAYYLSAANAQDNDGAEPIPKSTLINDKKTDTYNLIPGKTYLFRIIDMSAIASHFIQFEGHNMTVIAVDGVPVQPFTTRTIRTTAAQRYDVVIKALANPKKNYSFISQIDNDLLDVPQPDNVTISNGVLQYDPRFGKPAPLLTHGTPVDDFILAPADGQKVLGPITKDIRFQLNFNEITLNGQQVQRSVNPTIAMPSLQKLI
jgi:iron transport multicopper oxidase